MGTCVAGESRGRALEVLETEIHTGDEREKVLFLLGGPDWWRDENESGVDGRQGRRPLHQNENVLSRIPEVSEQSLIEAFASPDYELRTA